MPETSPTERLAAYAADFGYDQLSHEAIDQAKLIVLDTLGAMLLGSLPMYTASRYTADLARSLEGTPECTVVGRGFKADVAAAALANGTLGYAADVEGAGVVRQHAAAVLVPTVLTLGEREHASGRSVIAALAVGYEVCARLDLASESGVHYAYSFHRSALFGHFGAAAAAGHLLGLNPAQFENALGLAGINASGLAVWMEAISEDPRPFVIGTAAHRGIVAALLAQLGMGGPRGIADDGKYTIYDAFSGAMHLEEITCGLPADVTFGARNGTSGARDGASGARDGLWITHHSGFKPYPCCGGGGIHAAISALLGLMSEHGTRPEDVEDIVCRVAPGGGNDPVPLKSHSLHYLLAAAGGRGAITPETINVDYREHDPRVERLYARTRVVAHPVEGEFKPASAIVELRLSDGRTLTRFVKHRPGSPDDPLPRERIEAKFFELATTRLTRERAEMVRDMVERLDEVDDVARLAELLAVPETDGALRDVSVGVTVR